MIIIGLTGPSGSGKTSVYGIAKSLGFKVVNCDALARKAVEPGSNGLADIVSAFGEGVLNSDGSLNRKALASVAFSSDEKILRLNHTLFPHIKSLVMSEIGEENILLDAPTLFESGLDKICTHTVAVLADESIRRERIISRDGLSKEHADLRLHACKPDHFFIEKANYIVYNNKDIESFKTEINAIFKTIIGGIKNV